MSNNTESIEALETPIALSDSAIEKITSLLKDDNDMLRISVEGGGCSGFKYSFDIVKEQEKNDLLIKDGGAKVLFDEISVEMMAGTVIDYVESLGSAGFAIRNPNATTSCGCGNSFSV